SLHDSFVIVDEAQSLERNVLLTVLSRLGSGSRVVLTHDVAQRDNLRVGRYDGVSAVIEKLKGHPLRSEEHTSELQSREKLVCRPSTAPLFPSRRSSDLSLHDSFVIVDEAQSLERNVLLTVLSRLGSGSRVVLTHDVAQRDNLRVGRYDGVSAVIEKLKGHPL